MDLRSKRRESTRAQESWANPLRLLLRVFIVVAIFGIAFVKEYSPRQWVLLGLIVLWAAALPFLLRGLGLLLSSGTTLKGGRRKTLLWLAALVLVTAFVLTVRPFLAGG